MPINLNEFNNFLNKVPKNIIIILDFCYYDFLDEQKFDFSKVTNNNIICLFSFSKFHGLANLQLGFVITNKVIINLLKLCQITHVPKFKEQIALVALNDKNHNLRVKKYFNSEKNRIFKKLKLNKIEYIDSYQNFIYIKFAKYETLVNDLKKKYNINYNYFVNLEGYVILIIHSPEYNNNIIDTIIDILKKI